MNKINYILLAVLALAMLPTVYANTGFQTCRVNTACVIGEYVYNGTYTPYTTQICNITINTPSGITAINQAWMQNNSNGWHNYTYTPAIIGLYPAFITCLNGSDLGKADKSFISMNETSTGGIGVGLTAEEHTWLQNINNYVVYLIKLVKDGFNL